MKTLQTLRGPFSSVFNVFMLGLLLIGFSGRASGNICFEAIRFDNSDIPVIQTTLALKVSKYLIPEIFTPTAPDETLYACIQGWWWHG